jgi:hypothetical protein
MTTPQSIWSPSISNALGPGVYGVQVQPPVTLPAEGTDVSLIVEQFPWGPSQTIYEPTDIGDLILTYYPPGMNRNLAGPLALSQKGWPDPRVLRVTAATGTAIATATINKTGPAACLVVNLKYVGTAGNAVTWTVSAATDGNANHVNLAVTATSVSGTTTDLIQNINVSGTGADYLGAALWPNLRLIGSVTKSAAGVPLTGSGTFTGGLDGTVSATDYVGTQGLGDKGLSLAEGEPDINHLFFGNPGSSLLAACNAGMTQHCIFMGRQFGYIAGVAAQSASAAQTDVQSYQSDAVVYVDAWMQQLSDQDGSVQTIPTAALAASVAAQLSPSTKIAWRDSEVQQMMTSVIGLEQNRGSQARTNSNAGIVTLIKKRGGGFAFYSDPTTNAPNNTGAPALTDQRLGVYVLTSMEDGFQSDINGPNVPATQLPMRAAVTVLMEELVDNSESDPAHNPYCKAYSLGDTAAANPESQEDAGDFSIPVNMKTDAGMIRIFLPLQFGPSVSP